MLDAGRTHEEVYHSFRWQIPAHYNIGVDICDKWAQEETRLALIFEEQDGRITRFTFKEMQRLSNQLANALQAHGLRLSSGRVM